MSVGVALRKLSEADSRDLGVLAGYAMT